MSAAARAAQMVLALAVARRCEQVLGKETADRADAILLDLLIAAKDGGFVDADVLLLLTRRQGWQRWPEILGQLAADIVTRIGGPDKFFALLDLSSTPTDWIGFEQ